MLLAIIRLMGFRIDRQTDKHNTYKHTLKNEFMCKVVKEQRVLVHFVNLKVIAINPTDSGSSTCVFKDFLISFIMQQMVNK